MLNPITIWRNRKMIWEGMINTLIRKPKIEAIAFERMSICQQCELIDIKGDHCMVPGTAPCCSACGCKLTFKTRSMAAECAHPITPKWKAEMTPEEQDAHYEKINYNPDQE